MFTKDRDQFMKKTGKHTNIFIVTFPGGSLQYMNDPSLKLVFTSEDPSLVVLFDQRSGLHSVWKLRKATPQVCLQRLSSFHHAVENKTGLLFLKFRFKW